MDVLYATGDQAHLQLSAEGTGMCTVIDLKLTSRFSFGSRIDVMFCFQYMPCHVGFASRVIVSAQFSPHELLVGYINGNSVSSHVSKSRHFVLQLRDTYDDWYAAQKGCQ